MIKRLGVVAGTALATAALALTAAPPATADPFFKPRSTHSSYAECQQAGQAGADLWGLLYKCEPFPGRPDVYVLSVRI
ncbi:hypothetical protein ACFVIM_27665 [Streptomyces sp. NPDC057638]|uniref:hypothetical protein n=1 Tax=Streptomyces sp. NPDC057638 TaxID=3346190 RepID=UPI00368AE1EC